MKRILLVEDDEVLASVYAEGLRRAGFEVMRANDGVSALRLARTQKVDLILLDLMMPKLNGYEFLRGFGRWPEPKPKVYILSNLSDERDVTRATEAGAAGYLVKADLTPTELGKVVAEALRPRVHIEQ